MRLPEPLGTATLIRRYQRFLADLRLDDGSILTVHCPNTGSMLNCQEPGSRVCFSTADNPTRKYPHTWELIETATGHWVGIHTGRANGLVREAITHGVIRQLQGYGHLRAEARWGNDGTRFDFLLTGHTQRPDCYVEVKSVTLGREGGIGAFPDAVSDRATRHLRELMACVATGLRGVLVFCVQHTGIERVQPADDIDPAYGRTLREAVAAGVEVVAYGARIEPPDLVLTTELPVWLPDPRSP